MVQVVLHQWISVPGWALGQGVCVRLGVGELWVWLCTYRFMMTGELKKCLPIHQLWNSSIMISLEMDGVGRVICVLKMFPRIFWYTNPSLNPKCLCPFRTVIKKVMIRDDHLSHQQSDLGSCHLQRNPWEPGAIFSVWKGLIETMHLPRIRIQKPPKPSSVLAFVWNCNSVWKVSCWLNVLIGCGWHNRSFWHRIGLTVDTVTRAGTRSHFPLPLEWGWPWMWVPLTIEIKPLIVSCLSAMLIITPVAVTWFL